MYERRELHKKEPNIEEDIIIPNDIINNPDNDQAYSEMKGWGGGVKIHWSAFPPPKKYKNSPNSENRSYS